MGKPPQDARPKTKTTEPETVTEAVDLIPVVVYFPRMLNGLHFFEMTEDEIVDFEERYKTKEVMIMRSCVSESQYLSGNRVIETSLQEALSATVLPTMKMCTDAEQQRQTEIARESERANQRLREVLQELGNRNEEYQRLEGYYVDTQKRLTDAMAEIHAQR